MDASRVRNPDLARAVVVTDMQLINTALPLFMMKSVDIGKDPENPDEYRTITIDNNGSDDSRLIIFLNIGPSSSDYDQYQFSAAAAAVTDPSGVDSSPTHTQCTTLGALVLAINATAVGFNAFRLNGPADYSLDSDDFVDLTETDVSVLYTNYLYKDASEVLTMAARIGVPENYDHGHMELLYIRAFINSASATDCVMKVSRDPSEGDATEEVELGYERYVPDNAWTDLVDNRTAPAVHEGPLLVEVTSTSAMTETTSRVWVHTRPVEY